MDKRDKDIRKEVSKYKFENSIKKIAELQEQLDAMLGEALPALEKVNKNLERVNKLTGATKRAKDMREEIRLKGWEIVERVYNPENNKHDPAAEPLYEFYKFIYEDMKKKGEI